MHAPGRPMRGEKPGSHRVLLVSMPLRDPRYPALGLSLLKAILNGEGIPCDVRYLCLPFLARAGMSGSRIEGRPISRLLGEWPFAEALFGTGIELPRGTALPRRSMKWGCAIQGEKTWEDLEGLRLHAEPFLRWCLEEVPWGNYSLVGFTVRQLQQTASLALAKRVKERYPHLLVAFGGPNCQGPMGTGILRHFPFVDWVFSGEADISFPEAVRRHLLGQGPEGIPGVGFRKDGRIVAQGQGREPDLDALPHPDHSDYLELVRTLWPDGLPDSRLGVELSRGCWWADHSRCVFCSVNQEAAPYRSKSVGRAAEELLALAAQHPEGALLLSDTVLHPAFCRDLAPRLEGPGAVKSILLEARVSLGREDWLALKRAHVKAVQLGIESLDTEILALMRKGATSLQNIRSLKWGRELGVPVSWNFLWGTPGERPEAYSRMAQLIPALCHLHPPLCAGEVALERFSPLFRERERLGLREVRPDWEYGVVYPFTQDEMSELAYDFDFECDGREALNDYTAETSEEILRWQAAWDSGKIPILAGYGEPGGLIVLYDTRPCRLSLRTCLDRLESLAYAACEDGRSFEGIAGEVASALGPAYPGDDRLRACLESLVSRRFAFRDGDSYLGLANDLHVLAELGASCTARQLLAMAQSRFGDNLAPSH